MLLLQTWDETSGLAFLDVVLLRRNYHKIELEPEPLKIHSAVELIFEHVVSQERKSESTTAVRLKAVSNIRRNNFARASYAGRCQSTHCDGNLLSLYDQISSS